jgi:TatD DNase family protein
MFKGIYNDKQYHVDDLVDVLDRAKSMGVTRSVITGTTIEDSLEAIRLTGALPNLYGLYTTAGIHPTRSDVFKTDNPDDVIARLSTVIEQGLLENKVVALGECGLDYDRLHFCDKDMQMQSFIRQLKLGEKYDLPFFFHNRNTNGDFLKVISEHSSCIRNSGVVHSFDGSTEDLKGLLDLDLYIGINGCSMKTKESLEVIRQIPLDRLLIETDAPWCSIKPSHASHEFVCTTFPSKKRDKFESQTMVKDRGEPCLLIQVLEVIAAIKEISVPALGAITPPQ